MPAITTLYRPTGEAELALVAESGFRSWPPRLPEQPIFYPVTNEEYAVQIARDWNAAADATGYVTEFDVDAEYLARYPSQVVGTRGPMSSIGFRLRSLTSSTRTSLARSG